MHRLLSTSLSFPSRRTLCANGLFSLVALSGLTLHRAETRSPPERRLVTDFFGLHINNLASDPLWHPHTDYVDLGQSWLRLWSDYTTWKLVNPALGRFDWHRLDEIIRIGAQHGVKILYDLGCAPDWATGVNTGQSQFSSGVPSDDAWVQWVKAVVGRYGDRIAAYELWNEPNLIQTWNGTIPQMVHLASLATPIIRALAPNAVILSPCPTLDKGVPYLRKLVDAGILQWCTAVAVHPYTSVPEDITTLINSYVGVVRSAGSNLPVWSTEFGWTSFRTREGLRRMPEDPAVMLPDQAISYVSRFALCSAASQAYRSFFFTVDGTPLMKVPIVEPRTNRLLPAGVALRTMMRFLAGGSISGLERIDSHYQVQGTTAAGKKFLAAWCSDWGQATISASKIGAETAANPMGQSVPIGDAMTLSMTPTIFTLR